MSKNQSKITDEELAARMASWKPVLVCESWQDVLFEEIWRKCEEIGWRDNYSFLLRLLERLGCDKDMRIANRVYSAIEEAFADELRLSVEGVAA